MSWFGKGKSNDKARKKHVQSLMSRNGRLYTVIQQNRNSYKISFKTRMGANSFTVLLTEQFPEIAPRLYCDAQYSHPWLDLNGNIVGIEELNRWSSSYSDLGRIVQSVVMQFTASPPTLKKQAQPLQQQYKPIQPLQQVQPPSYQQHVNLKKQASLLDMQTIKFSIPQKIDKLEQLSEKEINEILSEPKLIEEFAYSIASGLREMRDQQQNEILRIGRSNLSKKDEITKKDKEIKLLREEIDTLSTYYNDLKIRQDKELKKFSKQRLNQELNKEIETSDSKTNEFKDKFDEGDIAPVAFIKKYTRERKMYHVLQIKKEKINIF
eukprot:237558_1